MEKIKQFLRTTLGKSLLAVLLLGIGFLGGMEYKAYQIRSVFSEAFGDFGSDKSDEEQKKESESIASNDLNRRVAMTIEKKGFATQSFIEANTFTFKFTNNTNKDIEGVQGVINFMDLFGNSIQRIELSYDGGIKAGESKLYDATVDYNQFIDEDIKLKNTELSKLKYDWDVDTIIYTDGSKEEK